MNKFITQSALLAASMSVLPTRGDHGVVYSEMCDPYGSSSYYEESIDLERRVRRIRANSCPHHYNICQESECAGNLTFAIHHDVDIEIPLYPGIARDDHVKSLRCSSGSVAISFNGVGFASLSDGTELCGSPQEYGAQNGVGSECDLNGMGDGTRYCGDKVQAYAAEFDYCGGHADRATGVYQYHVPPACLLQDLGKREPSPSYPSASLHSVQVGWALDGFPVYGPQGPDGVAMMPCTSAGHHDRLCLDSCNGYYGRIPGVDEYMYRYYVTGPVGSGECSSSTELNGGVVACDREEAKCCPDVLPSVQFAPYTLGCYRGCAYNDRSCLLSNELEGTSEYFFPALSNYLVVFDPTEESATPPEPELTPEPTVSPEPTPAEADPPLPEVDPIDSSRTVLQRVLSPHRGFSLLSSVAEGGTEVLAMGGDTRDTAVIGGVALDSDSGRVYYTTQSVVAWAATDGSGAGAEVISGITQIRILGYNFGSSVADVISITVKGEPCSSIVFVNSGEITCKMTKQFTDNYVLPPEATTLTSTGSGQVLGLVSQEEPLTAEDVTLVCTTGRMTGIHEQPETVARGRSGRMVVASVDITLVPHSPFAVAVSSPSSVLPNSVFWSDIGPAQCVYRALADGTQLQPVLTESAAVNDLYLYERYESSAAEGCVDMMTCSIQTGTTDAGAYAPAATDYDALFYVDASRSLSSGPTDSRSGVFGVLPVLREGALSPEPLVSTRPGFHGEVQSYALNTCSIASATKGTLSVGGVHVRTVPSSSAGGDSLLVSGLYQPRSVTVDESTGHALVVTTDGVLWRADVFAALQYYARLEAAADCCATLPSGQCARLVVDVSGFKTDSSFLFPDWLKVIYASPITYSKFMGVASVPQTSFNASGQSVSRLKNERRIFVADANMNRIWMVDLGGSNYRYIELMQTAFGASSKVLNPTDMTARISGDSTEIFVAEYLGKIWKLTIPLSTMLHPDLQHSRPPVSSSSLSEAINIQGSRSSVLDIIPQLVMDLSNFFVSNTARALSVPPFLGSDN